MAPIPSQRELAAQFARLGAFSAINHYVENGTITPDIAASWTSKIFQMYQAKTKEAQKEVHRIDAVLHRLAAASAAGAHRHPYRPMDPKVLALAHEVTTLDNWVMSLYETDLTMIWLAAPERAQAKPLEMVRSMEALRQKRLAELDFGLNAPDLFTRG